MDKRRNPNPTARRRDRCAAAIHLLAHDGAKGHCQPIYHRLALAAIRQQATAGCTKLHREILVQLMPRGAELEPAVVEDLSNVTLTFINGLLMRFAHGDRIIESPEQLDGILTAIATGILKNPNKGRLTETGGPRPARRRRVGASG